MPREIDIRIENLPHDIVYMETTITDTTIREDKFTNPSDAKNKVEKRQFRSGIGTVLSSVLFIGLGLYGVADIGSGIHNGSTEQIKSGVFEIAMCIPVGVAGYRSLNENSVASEQISKLKEYCPEKEE